MYTQSLDYLDSWNGLSKRNVRFRRPLGSQFQITSLAVMRYDCIMIMFTHCTSTECEMFHVKLAECSSGIF